MSNLVERLRRNSGPGIGILIAESASAIEALQSTLEQADEILWISKGETASCRDTLNDALAEIARLKADLAEAREVVKPFAAEAMRYEPPENDDNINAWDSRFLIGNLRSAAAWLVKTEGK